MELAKPRIGLYQPYPHTFGGVQSMVIKLARGLPALGYAPLIISPEDGEFTRMLRAGNVPFLVSDPGAAWHVYGRGARSLSYILSPRRIIQLIRYWHRLSIELRENRIALLHCNDYRGVMLAAPAARLARIPVIWHMHGFIPSRFANLVAAALVHCIVPVSRGMLDYLKIPHRIFGNYEVIHNGLETGDLPAAPAPDRHDFPVVLAVGALHPRKGYETLIHAFQWVAAKVPSAECWIAGGEFADGRYGQSLRQLAREIGVSRSVKFLGHSSEIGANMRRCSLLAVPSHIEAFGMVAIEAMMAGKPVVACRTGGLREIVADHETGSLIEPENAREMAEAIIEILCNQSLAQRMGSAGRARAVKHFPLEKMMSSFAGVYHRLLGGVTPQAGPG